MTANVTAHRLRGCNAGSAAWRPLLLAVRILTAAATVLLALALTGCGENQSAGASEIEGPMPSSEIDRDAWRDALVATGGVRADPDLDALEEITSDDCAESVDDMALGLSLAGARPTRLGSTLSTSALQKSARSTRRWSSSRTRWPTSTRRAPCRRSTARLSSNRWSRRSAAAPNGHTVRDADRCRRWVSRDRWSRRTVIRSYAIAAGWHRPPTAELHHSAPRTDNLHYRTIRW